MMSHVLVAGQILAGRFELRRLLGSGGMGEVFAAWDQQQRETVALKSLTRADAQTVARFKREFRSLQGLAHPNLVNLHELVRDGERWFFTMELVRGTSLLAHVGAEPHRAARPRFIEPRLRDSLGQLCRGLRALHASGLVHRDIKPSNVMVADDERVVLLDFGLVTELDPGRQSIDGRIVGTIDYMAPEQAVGGKVSEASDWYSVGVILYEALTGRLPYNGHPMQVLVDKQQVDPPSPAELMPSVPEDLSRLCVDLLAIEPARRPSGGDVSMRLGIDDSEVLRRSSVSQVQPSSVFVGRDDEIERLVLACERTQSAPEVHLLVGESGIGKSALVEHAIAAIVASDPNALVLRARCYERESVPYKAFDGIADGLAQHLTIPPIAEVTPLLPERAWLLPRLFSALQRVPAIAAQPALGEPARDPLEQRNQTFAALRELFVALAAQRRVVLTIDDLQWADADSYVLMRELLREPAPPRLLVIATVRCDDELPAAVRDGLRDLEPTISKVGRLDDAQCRELADEVSLRRRNPLDVDRLLREAHGHPMFLLELVRYAERVGDVAESPRLDDALWSRIEMLREDSRGLLEVVCLAGGPVVPEVAMAAGRIEAVTLGRAVASLKVAGLVRESPRGKILAIEPYHDRIREAVAARIPADRQRAIHVALAAALEATHERDPHLLLRHHLLAGAPARAAEYAEAAAVRATAAHAFDQAAALWRQALELVPRDVEDTRRVRIRLGEALVGAGRGADAAEQYLAAADGADPAARLEYRRHAGEQLLMSGRIERGVQALEALLRDIGVSVSATPRRALWSLLWNRARLRLSGLGFDERHPREVADTELLKIEALRAAAHGLAVVDAIRGAAYQSRCLRLSLETGSRREVARAIMYEGMFQSQQGNFAIAETLLKHGRELGPPDDPYFDALHAGGRGVAAYFAGNLDECMRALPRGAEMVRRVPGATWERASIRIFLLWTLRFIGDFVQLRTRVDEFLHDAEQRGDLYMDSTIRRSCTSAWLAADAPEQVMGELTRARWVPPSHGFHVQHFHELTALGELRLYGGESDGARMDELRRGLEGSLLTRISSIACQAAYHDARQELAARGSPRIARTNVRRLLRMGHPVATTFAHLIDAGASARAGDRDATSDALRRATQAAGASGMRASAAVARRLLGILQGGPAGDDLASDAELALRALGIRNPAKFTNVVAPGVLPDAH